jgi:cyanate lyase
MPLHIKFGDGIMSAIDFKAHVDKVVIWIHLHKDEKRLLTLYLG